MLDEEEVKSLLLYPDSPMIPQHIVVHVKGFT